MDVKVGQVWVTQSGLDVVVIEEYKDGLFKVKWPYGTITSASKESFSWWSRKHNEQSELSDLEIVQKAFDKSRLYFVLDKPGVLYDQYVAIENIESLLTWAKQTIGE